MKVTNLPDVPLKIIMQYYTAKYCDNCNSFCRARGPTQRSHPSQPHRSKNISPFRGNGPGVDIKITLTQPNLTKHFICNYSPEGKESTKIPLEMIAPHN